MDLPALSAHCRLVKTLGIGNFGKVKLAHHVVTGLKVAVKILSKGKIKRLGMAEKVRREIGILKMCTHPHIIRLYEVIDTPSDIFVIVEYVSGGELFDYIVSRGRLPPDEARHFFHQIVSGIQYLHHNGFVHNELKLENLMLDAKKNIKIADFGLSNVAHDGDFLRSSCGYLNYAAPEVISDNLYAGPGVDVWSCGVILYALLCGTLPFDDESSLNVRGKVQSGLFEIPDHLPEVPRELILRMLVVDPSRRAPFEMVLGHPWLQGQQGVAVEGNTDCVSWLKGELHGAHTQLGLGRLRLDVLVRLSGTASTAGAAQHLSLLGRMVDGHLLASISIVHRLREATRGMQPCPLTEAVTKAEALLNALDRDAKAAGPTYVETLQRIRSAHPEPSCSNSAVVAVEVEVLKRPGIKIGEERASMLLWGTRADNQWVKLNKRVLRVLPRRSAAANWNAYYATSPGTSLEVTTLLIVMGTRCKCDDDVAGALVDAVKSVRRNTSLRRVIVEVDSRTALGRSCSSQLCAEALRTRAAELFPAGCEVHITEMREDRAYQLLTLTNYIAAEGPGHKANGASSDVVVSTTGAAAADAHSPVAGGKPSSIAAAMDGCAGPMPPATTVPTAGAATLQQVDVHDVNACAVTATATVAATHEAACAPAHLESPAAALCVPAPRVGSPLLSLTIDIGHADADPFDGKADSKADADPVSPMQLTQRQECDPQTLKSPVRKRARGVFSPSGQRVRDSANGNDSAGLASPAACAQVEQSVPSTEPELPSQLTSDRDIATAGPAPDPDTTAPMLTVDLGDDEAMDEDDEKDTSWSFYSASEGQSVARASIDRAGEFINFDEDASIVPNTSVTSSSIVDVTFDAALAEFCATDANTEAVARVTDDRHVSFRSHPSSPVDRPAVESPAPATPQPVVDSGTAGRRPRVSMGGGASPVILPGSLCDQSDHFCSFDDLDLNLSFSRADEPAGGLGGGGSGDGSDDEPGPDRMGAGISFCQTPECFAAAAEHECVPPAEPAAEPATESVAESVAEPAAQPGEEAVASEPDRVIPASLDITGWVEGETTLFLEDLKVKHQQQKERGRIIYAENEVYIREVRADVSLSRISDDSQYDLEGMCFELFGTPHPHRTECQDADQASVQGNEEHEPQLLELETVEDPEPQQTHPDAPVLTGEEVAAAPLVDLVASEESIESSLHISASEDTSSASAVPGRAESLIPCPCEDNTAPPATTVTTEEFNEPSLYISASEDHSTLSAVPGRAESLPLGPYEEDTAPPGGYIANAPQVISFINDSDDSIVVEQPEEKRRGAPAKPPLVKKPSLADNVFAGAAQGLVDVLGGRGIAHRIGQPSRTMPAQRAPAPSTAAEQWGVMFMGWIAPAAVPAQNNLQWLPSEPRSTPAAAATQPARPVPQLDRAAVAPQQPPARLQHGNAPREAVLVMEQTHELCRPAIPVAEVPEESAPVQSQPVTDHEQPVVAEKQLSEERATAVPQSTTLQEPTVELIAPVDASPDRDVPALDAGPADEPVPAPVDEEQHWESDVACMLRSTVLSLNEVPTARIDEYEVDTFAPSSPTVAAAQDVSVIACNESHLVESSETTLTLCSFEAPSVLAADQADYLNCESMFTDASSVSLDTSCLAEVPAFATEVLCAPMLDRSTVADSSKHDSAELVDSLYFTIAAVGIAGTGVPDGATDAQVPKRDDPLSAAQPEPAEVSYPLDSCNPAPCIAQSGEDQRTAAGHLDGAGDSKLSNEVVDGREGDHAADESTDAVPQDARVIAFDEQRVADGSEASFSVCSFGMPHGAAAHQADYLNCDSMFTDATSISMDTSGLAVTFVASTDAKYQLAMVEDSTIHDAVEAPSSPAPPSLEDSLLCYSTDDVGSSLLLGAALCASSRALAVQDCALVHDCEGRHGDAEVSTATAATTIASASINAMCELDAEAAGVPELCELGDSMHGDANTADELRATTSNDAAPCELTSDDQSVCDTALLDPQLEDSVNQDSTAVEYQQAFSVAPVFQLGLPASEPLINIDPAAYTTSSAFQNAALSDAGDHTFSYSVAPHSSASSGDAAPDQGRTCDNASDSIPEAQAFFEPTLPPSPSHSLVIGGALTTWAGFGKPTAAHDESLRPATGGTQADGHASDEIPAGDAGETSAACDDGHVSTTLTAQTACALPAVDSYEAAGAHDAPCGADVSEPPENEPVDALAPDAACVAAADSNCEVNQDSASVVDVTANELPIGDYYCEPAAAAAADDTFFGGDGFESSPVDALNVTDMCVVARADDTTDIADTKQLPADQCITGANSADDACTAAAHATGSEDLPASACDVVPINTALLAPVSCALSTGCVSEAATDFDASVCVYQDTAPVSGLTAADELPIGEFCESVTAAHDTSFCESVTAAHDTSFGGGSDDSPVSALDVSANGETTLRNEFHSAHPDGHPATGNSTGACALDDISDAAVYADPTGGGLDDSPLDPPAPLVGEKAQSALDSTEEAADESHSNDEVNNADRMGNLEIAFHVQRFYHRLTAAGVTQVTVNQHLDQQHRELGEGRRRSRNFRSSTVHNAVRLLRERPNAPSGWQVSTKLMMLDALDILRCTCVDGSSAPQEPCELDTYDGGQPTIAPSNSVTENASSNIKALAGALKDAVKRKCAERGLSNNQALYNAIVEKLRANAPNITAAHIKSRISTAATGSSLTAADKEFLTELLYEIEEM